MGKKSKGKGKGDIFVFVNEDEKCETAIAETPKPYADTAIFIEGEGLMWVDTPFDEVVAEIRKAKADNIAFVIFSGAFTDYWGSTRFLVPLDRIASIRDYKQPEVSLTTLEGRLG